MERTGRGVVVAEMMLQKPRGMIAKLVADLTILYDSFVENVVGDRLITGGAT